jgi:hypothetical protein
MGWFHKENWEFVGKFGGIRYFIVYVMKIYNVRGVDRAQISYIYLYKIV